MKRKTKFGFSRLLILMLTLVLIATAALTVLASCGKPAEKAPSKLENATELGTGKTVFWFQAVMKDGTEHNYKISTDAATVGEALLALKLIAGENSSYGLYVTTVCGETLVWETDAMYWAFYVDGEYASTGVDSTAVTADAVYKLAASK